MRKLDDMTIQEKAHMANQRIRNLRKAGVDYYAVSDAEHYLDTMERNYFYEGKRYTNEQEKKRVEQVLDKFLSAKSSTLRGINKINRTRMKALKSHGIDIKETQITTFFDFLKTDAWKQATKYGDSGTLMDTLKQALDNGFTPQEIKESFEDFVKDDDVYIEDIRERFDIDGMIWE